MPRYATPVQSTDIARPARLVRFMPKAAVQQLLHERCVFSQSSGVHIPLAAPKRLQGGDQQILPTIAKLIGIPGFLDHGTKLAPTPARGPTPMRRVSQVESAYASSGIADACCYLPCVRSTSTRHEAARRDFTTPLKTHPANSIRAKSIQNNPTYTKAIRAAHVYVSSATRTSSYTIVLFEFSFVRTL
jgi:hypothetical protein